VNAGSLQITQISENYQTLSNISAKPAIHLARAGPITKVYFRRRAKTKSQVSEEQPTQERFFPASPEDFVLKDRQLPSDKNGQEECSNATRRRKCITPISTEMLRSLRLKNALNGHKPKVIPDAKKDTKRGKAKNKKVTPQSELLGNLLTLPNCYATSFPGLSDIYKSNETGVFFPEIHVVEIQKIATKKCRIAPSEVTAELLLASSLDEASSSGSSTKDIQLVINE
jgi:hypothetical protein